MPIVTVNVYNLKHSGHGNLLSQKINKQQVISWHTKFEYNATSGF